MNSPSSSTVHEGVSTIMFFISAISVVVTRYALCNIAGELEPRSSHLNRIESFRRVAQRVARVYDESARRNGRLNRPRASVLAAVIVHWLNRVTWARSARAERRFERGSARSAIADRDFYRRHFAASAVEGNARHDEGRHAQFHSFLPCTLPWTTIYHHTGIDRRLGIGACTEQIYATRLIHASSLRFLAVFITTTRDSVRETRASMRFHSTVFQGPPISEPEVPVCNHPGLGFSRDSLHVSPKKLRRRTTTETRFVLQEEQDRVPQPVAGCCAELGKIVATSASKSARYYRIVTR